MKKTELKSLVKAIIKEIQSLRTYNIEHFKNPVVNRADGMNTDSLENSIIDFEDEVRRKSKEKSPVNMDSVNFTYYTESKKSFLKRIIKEEAKKLISVYEYVDLLNKEIKKHCGTNCCACDDPQNHMIKLDDGEGGLHFMGRVNLMGPDMFDLEIVKNGERIKEHDLSFDKVKEYIKMLGADYKTQNISGNLEYRDIKEKSNNHEETQKKHDEVTEDDKMKEPVNTEQRKNIKVKPAENGKEPTSEKIKSKDDVNRGMTSAVDYKKTKEYSETKHPKEAKGTAAKNKKEMESDTEKESKNSRTHTLKSKNK